MSDVAEHPPRTHVHHPKEHVDFPDGSQRTMRTFRRIRERIIKEYGTPGRLEYCGEEIRAAISHPNAAVPNYEWIRLKEWAEVVCGTSPDAATLGTLILIALQVVCDNRGKKLCIESLVRIIKQKRTLVGTLFTAESITCASL